MGMDPNSGEAETMMQTVEEAVVPNKVERDQVLLHFLHQVKDKRYQENDSHSISKEMPKRPVPSSEAEMEATEQLLQKHLSQFEEILKVQPRRHTEKQLALERQRKLVEQDMKNLKELHKLRKEKKIEFERKYSSGAANLPEIAPFRLVSRKDQKTATTTGCASPAAMYEDLYETPVLEKNIYDHGSSSPESQINPPMICLEEDVFYHGIAPHATTKQTTENGHSDKLTSTCASWRQAAPETAWTDGDFGQANVAPAHSIGSLQVSKENTDALKDEKEEAILNREIKQGLQDLGCPIQLDSHQRGTKHHKSEVGDKWPVNSPTWLDEDLIMDLPEWIDDEPQPVLSSSTRFGVAYPQCEHALSGMACSCQKGLFRSTGFKSASDDVDVELQMALMQSLHNDQRERSPSPDVKLRLKKKIKTRKSRLSPPEVHSSNLHLPVLKTMKVVQEPPQAEYLSQEASEYLDYFSKVLDIKSGMETECDPPLEQLSQPLRLKDVHQSGICFRKLACKVTADGSSGGDEGLDQSISSVECVSSDYYNDEGSNKVYSLSNADIADLPSDGNRPIIMDVDTSEGSSVASLADEDSLGLSNVDIQESLNDTRELSVDDSHQNLNDEATGEGDPLFEDRSCMRPLIALDLPDYPPQGLPLGQYPLDNTLSAILQSMQLLQLGVPWKAGESSLPTAIISNQLFVSSLGDSHPTRNVSTAVLKFLARRNSGDIVPNSCHKPNISPLRFETLSPSCASSSSEGSYEVINSCKKYKGVNQEKELSKVPAEKQYFSIWDIESPAEENSESESDKSPATGPDINNNEDITDSVSKDKEPRINEQFTQFSSCKGVKTENLETVVEHGPYEPDISISVARRNKYGPQLGRRRYKPSAYTPPLKKLAGHTDEVKYGPRHRKRVDMPNMTTSDDSSTVQVTNISPETQNAETLMANYTNSAPSDELLQDDTSITIRAEKEFDNCAKCVTVVSQDYETQTKHRDIRSFSERLVESLQEDGVPPINVPMPINVDDQEGQAERINKGSRNTRICRFGSRCRYRSCSYQHPDSPDYFQAYMKVDAKISEFRDPALKITDTNSKRGKRKGKSMSDNLVGVQGTAGPNHIPPGQLFSMLFPPTENWHDELIEESKLETIDHLLTHDISHKPVGFPNRKPEFESPTKEEGIDDFLQEQKSTNISDNETSRGSALLKRGLGMRTSASRFLGSKKRQFPDGNDRGNPPREGSQHLGRGGASGVWRNACPRRRGHPPKPTCNIPVPKDLWEKIETVSFTKAHVNTDDKSDVTNEEQHECAQGQSDVTNSEQAVTNQSDNIISDEAVDDGRTSVTLEDAKNKDTRSEVYYNSNRRKPGCGWRGPNHRGRAGLSKGSQAIGEYEGTEERSKQTEDSQSKEEPAERRESKQRFRVRRFYAPRFERLAQMKKQGLC